MLWQGFLNRLPRTIRYTIGAKIDILFTDLIAIALTGKYAKREEKLILLKQLSIKLDHLKYFITILWEMKGLDENKYARLATPLASVGKMIGGLTKNLNE